MIDRLKKLYSLFSGKTKVSFYVLIVLMIVGSVLELIGISTIPLFITTLSDPEVILDWPYVGRVYKYFNISESSLIFQYTAIGLILVFLLKNSFLIGMEYLKARFVQNRRVELCKRLFTNYMLAPYTFHLRRNSSELLRNTSAEVRILCLEALKPLLQLILSSVMIFAIVGFLLFVEPLASITIFTLLGFLSILFLKLVRSKVEKYAKEEQYQRKVEYQAISEGFGGVSVSKLLNVEPYFIKNLVDSSIKTARANLFKDAINQATKPVMETLTVIGLIVLVVLFTQVSDNFDQIIPTLGLFGFAILKLQGHVTSLTSSFNTLKYNLFAIDPIYDDLKELSYADEFLQNEQKQEIKKIAFSDAISVDHLKYSYPDSEENVLNGINLEIKKGKTTAFVGTTGSGKTTLINLLLGMLKPDSGTITVDGENIWENIKDWQANIGFIPQHIYLSDQTIKHNVAYGRADEDIDTEALKESLEIAQIYDFIKTLPNGWNTKIGEHGVRISGGQRQRLGIARAVYTNPYIIVMDEATSSLDNMTEKNVMKAIRKASEGRTKIIIAHRLQTVEDSDIIYFLKDGKISSSGTYDELIEENEEFRNMSLGIT